MAETQRWQVLPTQLERAEFEQFVLPHLTIGSRGPATQRREFAPASRPTPVPQSPLRPLQSANRLAGQMRISHAKAACSACSKRTAACHQSSTTVAFGSDARCSRHSPTSPSLSTVAGVSAVTPATASACSNAPDAIVGLLRAKAKRDWLP